MAKDAFRHAATAAPPPDQTAQDTAMAHATPTINRYAAAVDAMVRAFTEHGLTDAQALEWARSAAAALSRRDADRSSPASEQELVERIAKLLDPTFPPPGCGFDMTAAAAAAGSQAAAHALSGIDR